jgi:hypothetical protein
LAVPGSEKKTRLCDRCFANVPSDLSTCPECGATLSSDQAIDTSDSMIYPELSRANLLRMRGDYSGAEDQCLGILKRYPNNAAVHTLLGDLHAEQDDLEQAAQWYELAIDLNPHSESDRQKLEAVRERQRLKDSASSVESLKLPEPHNNIPLFAGVSVLAVAVVGLIAYFVGLGVQPKTARSPVVAPVEAPSSETPSNTEAAATTPPSATRREPQVDRELSALVSQRSTAGGNLLSVLTDPRRNIVTVTYQVGPNEDPKRVGAELGRTVLDQSQETLIVTLRAVRQDRIVYMADIPRSRYNDVLSEAYAANPDAWIDSMVTNEWPTLTAPVAPPAEQPVQPDGGTIPPTSTNGAGTTPDFTPPLTR